MSIAKNAEKLLNNETYGAGTPAFDHHRRIMADFDAKTNPRQPEPVIRRGTRAELLEGLKERCSFCSK